MTAKVNGGTGGFLFVVGVGGLVVVCCYPKKAETWTWNWSWWVLVPIFIFLSIVYFTSLVFFLLCANEFSAVLVPALVASVLSNVGSIFDNLEIIFRDIKKVFDAASTARELALANPVSAGHDTAAASGQANSMAKSVLSLDAFIHLSIVVLTIVSFVLLMQEANRYEKILLSLTFIVVGLLEFLAARFRTRNAHSA